MTPIGREEDSGGGPPQSKTWRKLGAARRTRSVLECASPLALWNGAMANPAVAADVSPFIIPAGEEFEPTHVGCYDIPNAAGATGRGARRTRLGDDGNLTCRAEIT